MPDGIKQKWVSTGGETGPLGPPAANAVCPYYPSTFCYQVFEHGLISWGATNGAFAVYSSSGATGPVWSAQGGLEALGYPVTDEVSVADGTYQQFTSGSVVAPTGRPAFAVRLGTATDPKSILSAYNPGWLMDAPPTCGLPGGGCRATYHDGASLLLNNGISYGEVLTGSAAGKRYLADGAENGPAGYPSYYSYCADICVQGFQFADLYSSSAGTFYMKGAILRAYGLNGGASGPPTTDERCGLPEGGCRQEFTQATATWTPAWGAFILHGAIRGTWLAQGAEAGRLGYPTTNEVCPSNTSGCYQWFERGIVWWSARTGAHTVVGAIKNAMEREGWVWSVLGYPTTDEICTGPGGGCFQWFENAIIWWSPTTGAQIVHGGIKATYERLNWAWGPLGYPLTGEYSSPGAWRQDFQHGAIFFPYSAGSVSVRYW